MAKKLKTKKLENKSVKNLTKEEIKLQKIRLERMKVHTVAQSATLMFFIYLLAGLIGVMKNFFSIKEFFILLIMGISILFIATSPYMKNIKQEFDILDDMEKNIKSK